MSAVIIGNYPIINRQTAFTDEFAIQYISYLFTVKTVDTYKYLPINNDEYYGPSSASASSQNLFDPTKSSKRSTYRVIQTDVQNLNGGLTEIMVKTAGTQNIESPPMVRILPNYPLIFGLYGMNAPTEYIPGITPSRGSTNQGFGVQLTFITKNDIESENYVFQNMMGKELFKTFRGVDLPRPAQSPFQTSTVDLPTTPQVKMSNNILYDKSSRYTTNNYAGFICKEVTYEKIGGATKFQLIYAERGAFFSTDCKTPAGSSTASCETSVVYDIQ